MKILQWKTIQWRKVGIGLLASSAVGLAILTYATVSNLKPVPKSFYSVLSDSYHVQILDRYGQPLNTTYQNSWNIHNTIALYDIPDFLKQAFIISEDKRFYQHSGPDWLARSSALLANIKAMHAVRGASTITEQVIRMVNPRPRTVWSRWLEGFEATDLETHYSKDDILEFYLNQIPYTANRRGIAQAARYYFNRDLSTLSKKEMLALVILVRAPSHFDLWKSPKRIATRLKRLANALVEQHVLSPQEEKALLSEPFSLETPELDIQANAFVRYVKNHRFIHQAGWPRVKTTLDGALQTRIQHMLDRRLHHLKSQKVNNGAVLVVDHTTGEILAWVIGGKDSTETPGRFIDAVTTPRQPGSAMKPLLYSLALSKGWSAATVIDDSPLTESVGNGLHAYQNYSRRFHGPVTLRHALANSLNIPALKALQFVGTENYLTYLRELGFSSLNNHPNFYGDGLALGNGEVTLYELVQAYAALGHHGVFRPLTVFANGIEAEASYRIMAPEVASLIGLILSDPEAREMEFGEYSVLNLPVQTAVKTGTSSDYHDSWAVGFNYRYAVGVWMGNLDRHPMDGVTGSIGPALLLRSVFSELNRNQDTQPLPINKGLVRQTLCLDSKTLQTREQAANQSCQTFSEWFIPGTEPKAKTKKQHPAIPIRLRRPAYGLRIAIDPRQPIKTQAFEFYIQGLRANDTVIWTIDGKTITTQGGKYTWSLQKGPHQVSAIVRRDSQHIANIEETKFYVK